MVKRVSDVCAAADAAGDAGAPKRHCAGDESAGEAGCAHTRAESPANDCFDAPWMPGTDLHYLKNLQKLNPTHNPSHKYVSYRKMLVSFIIDVCKDLKLQHVTVHRALNYLDRLLSKRTDISRQSYQLVSTACIFVAGSRPPRLPLRSCNPRLLRNLPNKQDPALLGPPATSQSTPIHIKATQAFLFARLALSRRRALSAPVPFAQQNSRSSLTTCRR
jgi:hypothetical protein